MRGILARLQYGRQLARLGEGFAVCGERGFSMLERRPGMPAAVAAADAPDGVIARLCAQDVVIFVVADRTIHERG